MDIAQYLGCHAIRTNCRGQATDRYFGSLPDWREPSAAFDNVDYLKRMVPYAQGMSVRVQPQDAPTLEMITICRRMGYSGWYGVESSGREAVQKGIELLRNGMGLEA